MQRRVHESVLDVDQEIKIKTKKKRFDETRMDYGFNMETTHIIKEYQRGIFKKNKLVFELLCT